VCVCCKPQEYRSEVQGTKVAEVAGSKVQVREAHTTEKPGAKLLS
jgi:hypothetical protein